MQFEPQHIFGIPVRSRAAAFTDDGRSPFCQGFFSIFSCSGTDLQHFRMKISSIVDNYNI